MSYYSKTIVRDEEEDYNARVSTDKWIFLFLVLSIALIPLLVGGSVKEVVSPHITMIDSLSSGVKGDVFTHYKSVVLMFLSIVALCLLLSKIFFMNGTIKKTKLNIFLGIFIFAITISTLLSQTKTIALWGQYNRSDGAISYICYLALFFVALNIEYPKKALQYVMYSLYPFILINLILCTMNFLGHDAMTYKVVQKTMSLFLPEGASLNEGSNLIGTLNQWNYMSGMFAIMTVMFIAWAIIDKNNIRSIINLIVSIISLAIMLMSLSSSGFLTVVVIIPLLITLSIKSSHRKKALTIFGVFLVTGMLIFHVLAEKNPRIWDESIGFVIEKNPYIEEQPTALKSIDFNLSFVNRVYAAENEFKLPTLPERSIAPGSGRTYIWGKTVELTMKRPLFGFGLDTLAYHFPHYNIDARAGMYSEDTIVDKPHNMYIGIFYGTGIIGIVGFAGLALITVLIAMKAILARKLAIPAIFGVAWLAFLVQALFNDSLPAPTGPMWTIAGIMTSIILSNEKIEEITDGRND